MAYREDVSAKPRSWQYSWEKRMVSEFMVYATEEGGSSTWTRVHREDLTWALEQGAFLGGIFRGWRGREDGALLLYCRPGAKLAADRLLRDADIDPKTDPLFLVEERD